MKNLVKSSVVAMVLFGATVPAFAGVSGGIPRPEVVMTVQQGLGGGAPRPQLLIINQGLGGGAPRP